MTYMRIRIHMQDETRLSIKSFGPPVHKVLYSFFAVAYLYFSKFLFSIYCRVGLLLSTTLVKESTPSTRSQPSRTAMQMFYS
jgi:hypothetical protein